MIRHTSYRLLRNTLSFSLECISQRSIDNSFQPSLLFLSYSGVVNLTHGDKAQNTFSDFSRTGRSFSQSIQKEKVSEIRPNVGGWLMKELMLAPNVVSLTRLLSGPGIAILIIQESWAVATGSLIVAGVKNVQPFFPTGFAFRFLIGLMVILQRS